MEFLKFLVCFIPLVVAMDFGDIENIPAVGTDFVIEYTPSIEQQFVSVVNAFSLKFLNYLNNPQTEVLVSSFSVANMMSFLYVASGGVTEEELKKCLKYSWNTLDKPTLTQLFSLTHDLLVSTKPRFYSYNSSNTLLMDGRVGLIEDYRDLAKDGFQIPLTVIDFETEGKESLPSINEWISTRTNGYFNEIINDIDLTWDMLGIDVTYFKGVWKNKFSRFNTQPRMFHNMGSPNDAVRVPMMRMTARLEYYGDDTLKMIELPFKGGVFSMFILLPKDPQGFQTLEEGFEHALERAVFSTRERRVTVSLPKLKFNYTLNLSESLCDMNVSTICTPGLFNLSGMVRKKDVVMGDGLHTSFIELSEDGMNLEGYGAEERYREVNERILWKFEAFHPFLFSIIDTRSGMIMFLGSVKNLECEEDCEF